MASGRGQGFHLRRVPAYFPLASVGPRRLFGLWAAAGPTSAREGKGNMSSRQRQRLLRHFATDPLDLATSTIEHHSHVVQWQTLVAIVPDVRCQAVQKVSELGEEPLVLDICHLV
jgi:hypothetical protein